MQIFNPHILKGKVAFITGGGSGICMGITRAFLEHGAVCSIASRNKEKLKAAASLLSAQTGSECIAVQADVRNANELVQAVEATVKAFGKIDIVICGAAGNFLALAEGMSANAFKVLSTNFRLLLILT